MMMHSRLRRPLGLLMVLLLTALLAAACGEDKKSAAKPVYGFLSSKDAAAVAVLTGSSGWGVGGTMAFVDAFDDGSTMVMFQSDPRGRQVGGYVVSGTCGDRGDESDRMLLDVSERGHSDTRLDVGVDELVDEPHVAVVTDGDDPTKEFSCGEVGQDKSSWVAFGKVAERISKRPR